MTQHIPMVNLKDQYVRLKPEIDDAIQEVLNSAHFIKGPIVKSFEENLAKYLKINHVIACGNGTDALQIALMSLGLRKGDEVITPSFAYGATAEVIALLGLSPIFVDVDSKSFNTTAQLLEAAITSRTKVLMPVHLFGQSADIESIMKVAKQHDLFVIEDNAQSIGADFHIQKGDTLKSGTVGHISCTSFFPSKNLGCYGDGGAICTNDEDLAQKIIMIASHGQAKKYHHDMIGCNSRLDAIQAAVLNVKLKYLDDFCKARAEAAQYYTNSLDQLSEVITPQMTKLSSHVFHQYTLQIPDRKRDALALHLQENDIGNAIYYPLPLYKQQAFKTDKNEQLHHPVTEQLCQSVLSIPIHTELNHDIQDKVIQAIFNFFKT